MTNFGASVFEPQVYCASYNKRNKGCMRDNINSTVVSFVERLSTSQRFTDTIEY